jgi:hypothetical protein
LYDTCNKNSRPNRRRRERNDRRERKSERSYRTDGNNPHYKGQNVYLKLTSHDEYICNVLSHQHTNTSPDNIPPSTISLHPNHAIALPPLHQQKVQSSVTQHQEHTTNHPQPLYIPPKRQHIKPETAQNSTTRNLNVKTVLLVYEREVADLVDDQAFEAEVEDGEL